jgi:hypothetical protein
MIECRISRTLSRATGNKQGSRLRHIGGKLGALADLTPSATSAARRNRKWTPSVTTGTSSRSAGQGRQNHALECVDPRADGSVSERRESDKRGDRRDSVCGGQLCPVSHEPDRTMMQLVRITMRMRPDYCAYSKGSIVQGRLDSARTGRS